MGSVPLSNAEEVFRTVTAVLGDRLRRVPDGETGDRRHWIVWQQPVFAHHPDLETTPAESAVAALSGPQMPTIIQFRVRDHVDPGGVRFGRLGYADAAITSYAVFARFKAEDVIPAEVRFQVSLPTPIHPVQLFVTAPQRPILLAPYEAALLRELDQILASIPGDQLAIQWDAPFEVRTWAGIVGDRIPTDARGVAELASTLCTEISRPVHFIHIPVPWDSGDAYLEPLASLRLPATTELYLGLVHLTDGFAGTQRRIEAARQVIGEFGVATECGWGRRPPDTIPELLQLHKKVPSPKSACTVDSPTANRAQEGRSRSPG